MPFIVAGNHEHSVKCNSLQCKTKYIIRIYLSAGDISEVNYKDNNKLISSLDVSLLNDIFI